MLNEMKRPHRISCVINLTNTFQKMNNWLISHFLMGKKEAQSQFQCDFVSWNFYAKQEEK